MSYYRISTIKCSDSNKDRDIPIYVINLNRRYDRLQKFILSTQAYSGSIYRYEAIDTLKFDDLSYAKSLDCDLKNWSCWERGLGGYGNRFSHIDLLSNICQQTGYKFFAVIEDDVNISSTSFLLKILESSKNALMDNASDVFVLSGWDYKPKQILEFSFLRRTLARCYCTLGTQFNIYSLDGAISFLSLSNKHLGIHLDEVIARLQVSGELSCLGYMQNPFKCYISKSDVSYK